MPRYRAAVLGVNCTNELLNPPDEPTLADIVALQIRQDAGLRDYVLDPQGAACIIADVVTDA